MTNFYLVRHGDKLTSQGNPSLSNLGIQQARLTAKYFRSKKTKKLLASPFKRTIETATIISNEGIGIEVIVSEKLKERLWGKGPGQTAEDFMNDWNKTEIDRYFEPPEGDSSWNAGARLQSAISELENEESNVDYILVSHGGVIMDLLKNLFNENEIKHKFQDYKETGLSECSITHIVYENGKFKLETVNYIGHLSMSSINLPLLQSE